ncbi:cytochrome B [Rhodoferax koreense]|uniref:Cytochrome B n=1 Tax=Rhodoferax koreensis TaxID=1842727 RepID=A0A1P8K349_9BURK|nr:cytochrome b/b6 domain-containing protein [Rhodoferax koreense]APW40428.1 cytochrome B [Rhodoferax koreense]
MANVVRVWDLPTRLFHWALALSVVALVVTAYVGGNAMVWHLRLGYTVLSLLLFRLVWGLIGGRWSRFSAFIYSPATLLRYLRGRGDPAHSVGHTPLGAVSVFALLAALLVQVASGLMSDDEISAAGPLTRFVASETVEKASWYHTQVGQWIVIGLVALHTAAILFYAWRRHNLVASMIHGDKHLPHDLPSSRDDAVSRIAAALLFAVCVAVVTWLVGLGTP